jgi:Tol biopolymer transport system component
MKRARSAALGVVHFKSARAVCLLSLACALTACGGGGGDGGGGSQPTPPPTTNQAPTNVRLVEVSSTAVGEVSASWLAATDDSTSAASIKYQVHASTAAGFVPSTQTLQTETTGQVSTRISSNLTPGTRYFLRLVAIDQQGASTSSGALAVTVADTRAQLDPAARLQVLDASQYTQVRADTITLASGTAAPAVDAFVSSAEGGGFLRRVTAVSSVGGATVLTTRQASLNEVVSGLQLSTSIRMSAIPGAVSAGASGKSQGAQSTKGGVSPAQIAWKEAGLKYAAGRSSAATITEKPTGIQPSRSALASRFDVGPTTTASGSWAKIMGPEHVALEEGASGRVTLTVTTTTDDTPLFGSRVSICKLETGLVTNEDPSAKPREMNVGLLGSLQLNQFESDSGRVKAASQELEIGATSGTASSSTYRVTVTAYLQDIDLGCKLSPILGRWRETIDFELTIYVGNDVFPSNEQTTSVFTSDRALSITNDANVSFDPSLSYDFRIGETTKRLDYAKIELNAKPMIVQTLTIRADAQGTIDDQHDLIAPRKFFKVYVTPGGLPVIISGEFRLKLRIQGDVTGALDATEEVRVGFDPLAYGIECVSGNCTPIEKRTPVVTMKVGGNGNAEASLRLSLLPSLELTLYEGVTGKVVLEPYVDAQAGIEGFVQFDAAIDPGLQLPSLATDADYRLTRASMTTGLTAYLYADLHVWDFTLAEWPAGARADDYSTYRTLALTRETIAELPALTATVDMAAIHTSDIRAIRVKATAQNAPNPWQSLFSSMPASFITWQRWTTPRIIAPLGTPSGSYAFLSPPIDDPEEFWVVVTAPGIYVVRLGGFNNWGTWARQYTEVPITVVDMNGNGILDYVEARTTPVVINVQSVVCTEPVAGREMVCTVTGENLPESIWFAASNCTPSQMAAMPGATASQRQFGCTPVAAGLPVDVSYDVPGFSGALPSVPTLPAGVSPIAPSTKRINMSSDGAESNTSAYGSSISADGRFVAFYTNASNLVLNDTNDQFDVFVRDTWLGRTVRVSVASDGQESNWTSVDPAISGNGRYVVFASGATNLVIDDSNGVTDIFLHDLQNGVTERISVSNDGTQARAKSEHPSISHDGRYISFTSGPDFGSSNSVFPTQIYVHDRATRRTELISLADDGTPGKYQSYLAIMSADGSHVVFQSHSALVPADTNGESDVYVRDLEANRTERVSVASDGSEGDSWVHNSYGGTFPSISADGRFVAFGSMSTNLVRGDVNGAYDLFVRDRQLGITERVSVSNSGAEGSLTQNGRVHLSANGRFVAFASEASSLVENDWNGMADIFVHDREARTTKRVSLANDGEQADDDSMNPHLSADGRFVSFESRANNLVPEGTRHGSEVFLRDQGTSLTP